MQNDTYEEDGRIYQYGEPPYRPEEVFEYFLHATGERSVRAIAQRIGLDQSKVNRQLSGSSELKVQTVVAIARAYGLDLVDSFKAAGFITYVEAEKYKTAVSSLQSFSDIELSQEILRRISAGKATATLTEPMSVSGTDQDLSEMDEDQLQARYDLAANNDHTAPNPEDHTP